MSSKDRQGQVISSILRDLRSNGTLVAEQPRRMGQLTDVTIKTINKDQHMPLSYFVLMLWVFLASTVQLGWWAIDGRLMGFIGLAAVVIFVLESIGVFGWRVPVRKV